MALTDKNIVITPNIGAASDPKIVFSGADAATAAQNITLTAYPTNGGTLSFDGSTGQLFSVTNSMSGTIFSANDVSGIPSIEVLDTGLVKIAQYSGNLLLGSGTDTGLAKLQVTGSLSVTGNTLHSPTSRSIYGPNPTWSSYLYVGGDGVNGITRTGSIASIATTNGNMHIDSGSDKAMYLNHYSGTGGIQFGNGASGTSATLTAAGVFNGTNVTVNGNQTLHAGNYTSYSPTLTGGSASGTWSIAITGNAGTATTAAALSTTSTISSYMSDVGVLFQSYNASASNAAQFNITHAYGAVTISNARGALTLTAAGSASTASTAFAVNITGGTGWDSSAAGKGGAVNITGGRSGNNTTSSGAVMGGTVTITGGAGNTLHTGATPGGVTIFGGAAQIAGQRGADVTVSASNGFSSATSADGGNLYLTAGGGVSSGGANGFVQISAPGGGAGTNAVITFRAGSSERARINTGLSVGTTTDAGSTNILAAGNITAYSDIRLKTDLKIIPNALFKVKQLTGYTYIRTDSGVRQTGLVAQDVQKVLPEAVSEGEYLSLAYGNMVGLLVEAIKEQQTIIDSQESRIARLENLVSKLIEG